MQDPSVCPRFLHPDSVILLRHIFDVACVTLRDRVTDGSRARIHGVVGRALADLAKSGEVDPDHLLEYALARGRAALN